MPANWARMLPRMKGRQNSSGFTFLEIMLVVMILGLVTALAMPDFRSLENRQNLESFSRRFTGLTRHARAEAIGEGQYTYLDFDFSENTIVYGHKSDDELRENNRVVREDDEDLRTKPFPLPGGGFIAEFSVPEEQENLIYDSGTKARVYFYPDGTATPALIALGQERPARDGKGMRVKYYTIEIARATALASSYPGPPKESLTGLKAENSDGESPPNAHPTPLAGRRDSRDTGLAGELSSIRNGL